MSLPPAPRLPERLNRGGLGPHSPGHLLTHPPVHFPGTPGTFSLPGGVQPSSPGGQAGPGPALPHPTAQPDVRQGGGGHRLLFRGFWGATAVCDGGALAPGRGGELWNPAVRLLPARGVHQSGQLLGLAGGGDGAAVITVISTA